MAQNRTSAGFLHWGGLLLVAVAGIALAVAAGSGSNETPPAPKLQRTLPLRPVSVAEDALELPTAADRVLPLWPVEAGTIAGTKAAPVVAGTSIAVVEQYLAPCGPHDGLSELVAVGAVVVFDAETPVETIRHPTGKFTILRPTDGPHKGKTLVARDGDVRRS